MIRASELAQFAYCARGWWLTAVQGIEPGNVAQLEAGMARHTRHGRQVMSYHRLRRLGYAMLVGAGALALLAVWVSCRG